MKTRPKVLVIVWITSFIFLSAASSACALGISVTTTADAVNGNVSSVDALIANPGLDGISLREAILAVNNTPGSHTITFSSMLAGQVVTMTNPLPVITREHLTIQGFADKDGKPAVTLNTGGPIGGGFIIHASNFTLTHLRFAGVSGSGWGNPAVDIRVDERIAASAGKEPVFISNIRVEDNIFEGAPDPACTNYCAYGINIGTWSEAPATTIKNVDIARNSFSGFDIDGDGVMIHAHATDALIEDVTIRDNQFSHTICPVELVPGGSNNRISNTRILRNLFVENGQPITLINTRGAGIPTGSGNTIENTFISQNIFRDNGNPAIAICAGIGTHAMNNAVLNTRIINNLITGTRRYSVIGIEGGSDGASQNRVDGVQIVNNTIAKNPMSVQPGGPAVGVNPDFEGLGNSVTGVAVINTVFWDNPQGDLSGLTPDQVHFCITSQEGFAGVNGTLSADPKFVNSAGGDFRLQAGSPAIDAGTSQGAPETDLEGHPRFDDPATVNTGGGEVPYDDIGCFEYHSPNVASLTIIKEGSGSGTVTSSPAGIDCGTDCSEFYAIGTEVTLAAMPGTGSVFSGWTENGCSGTGGCAITLDGDRIVTATFNKYPIILGSLPDKTILNGCSLYSLPIFAWTTEESFKKFEVQFSTDEDFASRMVKVKAPSGALQATVSSGTWKQILMLPGKAGGPVYWRVLGTRSDHTIAASNVYSVIIGALQGVENAEMEPVSKGVLPTLSWSNNCNIRFRVWFGKDSEFSRKTSLSYGIKNPTENGGFFAKTITKSQWGSIRKLVGDVSGSKIYWYVESWDGSGRHAMTAVFSFILTE